MAEPPSVANRRHSKIPKEDRQGYDKDTMEVEDDMIRVVPVLEEQEVTVDEDWSIDEVGVGPITTDALLLNTSSNEAAAVERTKYSQGKKKKKKSSKRKAKGATPKRTKPLVKKYKAIGRTITQGDKSYELMFDMLLGIRISVSIVSAKKRTQFNLSDASEVDNYFMPSAGTIMTPAHPGRDFQFTDYAPKIFRQLREDHGIDSADYLISLTADYVLSEIVSPGKSGSFFYFSHDTKYMLKTITPSETRFLKKILRSYSDHVKNNPDTLVIRFYGFHMVQPHGGPKMHFVVMGNIFAQSLEIQKRYDLKGSITGRSVGEEALANLKSTTILKDLDFDRDLCLGPEKREIFFKQLTLDSEFLQRQDIMDYSLLLGIHNRAVAGECEEYEEAEGSTIFTKDHGGFGATDENNETLPEIYFMGIIDILQPYNLSKQVEHTWKANILRLNKFEISAVSPTLYADRFLKFIQNHVSTNSADVLREEFHASEHLHGKKKKKRKKEGRSSSVHKKKKKKKEKHEEPELPPCGPSDPSVDTPIPLIPHIIEDDKESSVERDLVETATTTTVDAPLVEGNVEEVEETKEEGKKIEKGAISEVEAMMAPQESSEVGVEVLDRIDFDVRVPKRKRAREKSKLHLHSLLPKETE